MENFWTSKKPIKGLRHFVLINKTKEKDQIIFLLVSVIDVEINLKITYEDLVNSDKWEKGWLSLSKKESITKDYAVYKNTVNKRGKNNINRRQKNNRILINDDSIFNIS